jgi:hypothetical protein
VRCFFGGKKYRPTGFAVRQVLLRLPGASVRGSVCQGTGELRYSPGKGGVCDHLLANEKHPKAQHSARRRSERRRGISSWPRALHLLLSRKPRSPHLARPERQYRGSKVSSTPGHSICTTASMRSDPGQADNTDFDATFHTSDSRVSKKQRASRLCCESELCTENVAVLACGVRCSSLTYTLL